MSPILVLCIYGLLIACASYFGGWLPSLIRLTHLRVQIMISLVSGLMLGVAVLHLMPHSFDLLGDVQWVSIGMLMGILVMFFLMRMFHVHHHGEEEHEHQADHEKCDGDHLKSEFSWYGLFFGMALHTVLDGFALAASVAMESDAGGNGLGLVAFGTFLAVLLHKPLDALSITSLMHSSGIPANQRRIANACFALACPLGVVLFWLGAFQWFDDTNWVIGLTLAFSAGFFLCIALADLLPEVHFHSHDRLVLSVSLVAGVALAFVIELFHDHDHHQSSEDNTEQSIQSDE